MLPREDEIQMNLSKIPASDKGSPLSLVNYIDSLVVVHCINENFLDFRIPMISPSHNENIRYSNCYEVGRFFFSIPQIGHWPKGKKHYLLHSRYDKNVSDIIVSLDPAKVICISMKTTVYSIKKIKLNQECWLPPLTATNGSHLMGRVSSLPLQLDNKR